MSNAANWWQDGSEIPAPGLQIPLPASGEEVWALLDDHGCALGEVQKRKTCMIAPCLDQKTTAYRLRREAGVRLQSAVGCTMTSQKISEVHGAGNGETQSYSAGMLVRLAKDG